MAWTAVLSAAETFTDDCESPDSEWAISSGRANLSNLLHHRETRAAHGGKSADRLRVNSADAGFEIEVIRQVAQSRVTDELKGSLWVRSPNTGLQLAIGIVFPHQRDPRTNELLKGELVGPRSTGSGEWEQLTCGADANAMAQLQGRIRSLLSSRIDPKDLDFREPYVDRVALLVPTVPGTLDLLWDDLKLEPIITPNSVEPASLSHTDGVRDPLLSWADDRLLSDGRPYISRFITYQGEEPATISEAGFNGVWVPDYQNASAIRNLSSAGLKIIATPPEPANPDPEAKVSLAPFTDDTTPIDCWMLGSFSPGDLTHVQNWVEQVQDADRRFGRPLMGDVTGNVRQFHRYLPLLVASRHILNTSRSPADLYTFLEQRRFQALPGRPLGTILPCEPSPALMASRRVTDVAPVIEPEQIALCAHIAAAAGFKQFGFGTHQPLQYESPGYEERRLMLKLINLELELLEPWLATGKVQRTTDIRINARPVTKAKRNRLLDTFRSDDDLTPGQEANPSPIRSTLLRSDVGLLVLVDWLEADAQFQPGTMLAHNLKIPVPGFDDVTRVWEVTTTDIRQISLDLQSTAGGVNVPLPMLDQHAAIVMTHDARAIENLKNRVMSVRANAAETWVALAKAKLGRVEAVHLELQTFAPPLPNTGPQMEAARRSLESAEQALQASRYDDARRQSQQVLELTRVVQRAWWEQATEKLSSPVASPHAICFQTLPDHWRLFNRLSKNPPAGENLLPSGNFEDESTILAADWKLQSTCLGPDSEILPDIGLETPSQHDAAEGRYALWISAATSRPDRTPILEEPLVTCLTPPMAVYSGQVVRISGKILIPQRLEGSSDGLMIYDTLNGSIGAHRFRNASPGGKWQTFEIYREVKESTDFHVVVQLCGLGRVWLDDLTVTTTSPDTPASPAP